jgi:alpha-galactosidase
MSILLNLACSWARERQVVETKLTHGTQTFGSSRGVSGHQHNPFAGSIAYRYKVDLLGIIFVTSTRCSIDDWSTE